MEKFSERELQRQLRGFEEVWRRVDAVSAPKEAAERCGVRLMPRQRRCRRKHSETRCFPPPPFKFS